MQTDENETWAPPIGCVFKGTIEQFLNDAPRRIFKLGGNCQWFDSSIVLYLRSSEIAKIQARKQWNPSNPLMGAELCFIVPWAIPGGHCRLEFQLLPKVRNDKEYQVSAKEQVEMLLESYRTDGWLECPAPEKDSQVEPKLTQGETDPEPILLSIAGLTPREQEIAQLLAQGNSKKEIAETLIISWDSVKTHCKNISDKWGLGTTRNAAMVTAAREKVLGDTNSPSSP